MMVAKMRIATAFFTRKSGKGGGIEVSQWIG
jgi:hypothetical protein